MNWKKLLPVVGIVIFIYLVNKIGLISILKNMGEVNFIYFFISILMIPIILILQTTKWVLILKKQRIKLKFNLAFKYYLISLFYGIITPARIGALTRASYMQEKVDKPWVVCASGIVLERILDLIIVFFMALLGIIIFSEIFGALLPTLIISIAILLIGCFIIFHKKTCRFVLKKILKIFMPKRLKAKSEIMFNSFYDNLPPFKKLIFPLIFTLFTWSIIYLQAYFVAKSFGIDIFWLLFLVLMPIGTIIALIPISISGLGTREITNIYIFQFFGVSADKILTFSVVAYLLNSIIPLLVALLSFKKEIRKRKKHHKV